MAREKRGATRKDGSPRPSARTVRESVPEYTQAVLGERIEYECHACNHEADAAYRIDRYTKTPHWFVGNAFTTRCPRGGECLRLHCEWLSELGIEVTPEQLLTDPRPALRAAGARDRRQSDRPPPPLPGLGFISGWHSRLLERQNVAALNYLLGRGILLETIARYQIGWDCDRQRLTFPMRDGLLKTRPALCRGQMRCWPGKDRDWPLYPEVPRDAGWALLVAGELDALCGISAGLPAVSVTLGAGTWRPEWTDELRDLYVVVCFDNNETALARHRVREFCKADVRARHLDLRNLGLNEPKGDLSDYLNSGGDPKRIKPPGRKTK